MKQRPPIAAIIMQINHPMFNQDVTYLNKSSEEAKQRWETC